VIGYYAAHLVVSHPSDCLNQNSSMNHIKALLIMIASLFLSSVVWSAEPKPETLPAGENMYVIERDMPGLGKLSPEELRMASQKSCKVLRDLGPQSTWLHSYVTGDKMYCIYLAPNEEIVREHAKEGGFPANKVSQVTTIISPDTAK
jgi:hypothetical protein